MSRIEYLLKKLFKVNYKEMYKAAQNFHKKRKKPTLYYFFDMIWCGILYGAGYSDYVEFEFDLLNHKQRKTYLTSNINNNIIRKYNDKRYWHIFNNKVEFNGVFKNFLKRDYLYLKEASLEDFQKFLKGKTKVCVKPIDQTAGAGVEIVNIDENTNIKELYQKLLDNNQHLVEDFIVQHHEMNALFSRSVNSLRIISFLKDDGEVVILRAVLKIGMRDGIDNHCNGGVYTFLNDEGVVEGAAADDFGNDYTVHPISHAPIKGFKVPKFKEACEMIKEAGKVVPQIRFVGWDVAITEDGPVIIEGNEFCGLFQMKASISKDKIGDLPRFREFMDI